MDSVRGDFREICLNSSDTTRKGFVLVSLKAICDRVVDPIVRIYIACAVVNSWSEYCFYFKNQANFATIFSCQTKQINPASSNSSIELLNPLHHQVEKMNRRITVIITESKLIHISLQMFRADCVISAVYRAF